jgi:hypothetical protein
MRRQAEAPTTRQTPAAPTVPVEDPDITRFLNLDLSDNAAALTEEHNVSESRIARFRNLDLSSAFSPETIAAQDEDIARRMAEVNAMLLAATPEEMALMQPRSVNALAPDGRLINTRRLSADDERTMLEAAGIVIEDVPPACAFECGRPGTIPMHNGGVICRRCSREAERENRGIARAAGGRRRRRRYDPERDPRRGRDPQ